MGFGTRLLGVTMVVAMSTMALGVTAGSAIAAKPATVEGRYRLVVDWQGAGHGTLHIVLNADGTGKLAHFGNPIAWTTSGTAFQMVIGGGDPATFDGVTTARGFNTKKHPGTMTNMAGDRGTWYARSA